MEKGSGVLESSQNTDPKTTPTQKGNLHEIGVCCGENETSVSVEMNGHHGKFTSISTDKALNFAICITGCVFILLSIYFWGNCA